MTPDAMRAVVLVGLRRAAIDSAERLGLRAILVAESHPGPRTAARLHRVVETPFDASPEAWEAVAADLTRECVDAVVALTERAVVPAAHLRAVLGLGGLSPDSARLCTHKAAMKRAVRAAGLTCADFVDACPGQAPEALSRGALVERLGLPLVVKPCVGSGGRGAYVAQDSSEVPGRLPDGWMAEAFVQGTEMSAEGIGAGGRMRAMNPTRYLVVGESSLVPGPLAEPDAEAIRALHSAAWAALGVERGMTHMEAFLTPRGPVFSEMAARPPGGHVMRLISLAYGVDAWELAFRAECGDAVALPRASQTAAAWILHPGAGVIRRAEGIEAAREMPGVIEATLRVQPGDSVGRRTGTGEEVGHLIVVGATLDETEARLRDARSAIRLELDRPDVLG